jgi:hypothetical protein
MDRVYDGRLLQNSVVGSRGMIIVSRRLFLLILKKSLKGQWLHSYFELKKAIVFDDIVYVKAIGTNGIFLGVM